MQVNDTHLHPAFKPAYELAFCKFHAQQTRRVREFVEKKQLEFANQKRDVDAAYEDHEARRIALAKAQQDFDIAMSDAVIQRKRITSKPVLRIKAADFFMAGIERIERKEPDGRNLIQKGWDQNLLNEARDPASLTAALRERQQYTIAHLLAGQDAVAAAVRD